MREWDWQTFKEYLQLGAHMSFKLHPLMSHLDYLPYNCGDLGEVQRECFQPAIRFME